MLAGAVLEEHLRRLAQGVGAKASGNLESLNNVLHQKRVYQNPERKIIDGYIQIRNSVVHGKFDEVLTGQVEGMLEGVKRIVGLYALST